MCLRRVWGNISQEQYRANPTLRQGQCLRSIPSPFSVILHHSKSSVASPMTFREKYEKYHKKLKICDDFTNKASCFYLPKS